MMQMKNSFQKETAEIIRVMSNYKTLVYAQVIRMFPDKTKNIEDIIKRLIKQKRLFYDQATETLSYGYERNKNPDKNLITAFWVLVDFFGAAEFYYPSDYPVQIAFFMDEGLYEIIKTDYGKETMINHILSNKNDDPPNRIIIVDSEEQIPKITAGNIFCFCTVDETGKIEYFNFE